MVAWLQVENYRTNAGIQITSGLCRMKKRRDRPLRPLPERAAEVLATLKRVRGLSVEEKSVHALGLAATPEERWAIFENFVRSAGYWRPLKRRRSGLS